MKKFLALVLAAAAVLTLVPTTAEAGHSRRSSHRGHSHRAYYSRAHYDSHWRHGYCAPRVYVRPAYCAPVYPRYRPAYGYGYGYGYIPRPSIHLSFGYGGGCRW